MVGVLDGMPCSRMGSSLSRGVSFSFVFMLNPFFGDYVKIIVIVAVIMPVRNVTIDNTDRYSPVLDNASSLYGFSSGLKSLSFIFVMYFLMSLSSFILLMISEIMVSMMVDVNAVNVSFVRHVVVGSLAVYPIIIEDMISRDVHVI